MPSRGPLERRLVVPVQDLFGPVEYGVHGVVVLGYLAGVRRGPRNVGGLEGALEIVGLIEAVELL